MDWKVVAEKKLRFENLVAVQLLKWLFFFRILKVEIWNFAISEISIKGRLIVPLMSLSKNLEADYGLQGNNVNLKEAILCPFENL